MRLSISLLLTALLPLYGYTASAHSDTEQFVARLKNHYGSTLEIHTFALKYHFLNRRYRDLNYWDHHHPNLYMSQRMVEVDLANKQFYDNDILYYSGGRLFDRVQFQNDKESYFYEKSATSLGRAVLKREMTNFDRFKRHIVMNVDVLALRPILLEPQISAQIRLVKGKKVTTLLHTLNSNQEVEYRFNNDNLDLISITHSGLNSTFVYQDRQTIRGIRYAQSVRQYVAGSNRPTYIKSIDSFEPIAHIANARLRLPKHYGPILTKGDGVLTAREIAEDLFLLTDSSEINNVLVNLVDNQLYLYGGASNTKLANQTLAFIKQTWPNKSISSIFITHPHGHQISGLLPYVNKQVSIIADPYTISGIKAYPKFQQALNKFSFIELSQGQKIANAQFYTLENMHAKRQSFAHFANADIIFQSHFVHVPQDNSISTTIPTYTKRFIDFINQQQLTFSRIVGNYRNNNITAEIITELNKVEF